MAELHTLEQGPGPATTITFEPAALVSPSTTGGSSMISYASSLPSSTISSPILVSSSKPLPLTTSHSSPPNFSTYTARPYGTAYSSGNGNGGDSPINQNDRNLKILFLVIGVLICVIVLFFLLRLLKWFFFGRVKAEQNATDPESQASSVRYLDPANPETPRSESPFEIFEKPHIYHYTKRSSGSRSTIYE
ncbi:hypothetical protein FRC14_000893 [Serendipita sp. 396]|nr:hypothetical protein FRC14_000893 [Serendipita sp. 396]KAG8785767.1 hypothetical protein FRC15_000725 [Serendipita sp. 397]KAG8869665.1 hypothetical protein FRC20_001108 [Serendipita sp. 405]